MLKLRSEGRTNGVVEVSSGHGLLNWRDIIRVRVGLNNDLHALTQPCKLVSNITRPAETLELQELLIAELLRVVRLGPLLPNIKEREVVATWPDEVLSCLISMQLLVLWSVEQ